MTTTRQACLRVSTSDGSGQVLALQTRPEVNAPADLGWNAESHSSARIRRVGASAARRFLYLACSLAQLFSVPSGNALAQPAAESLDALLEFVRREHNLPALAAAVVCRDGTIAVGAVGVRKTSSDDPITLDDRFHIGSCTKSMTATVCAVLVEQGRLSWAMTIGDAFPELRDEIRPESREVTLEQLLAHRSGLASDREPDRWLMLRLRTLMGPMQEQRREFLKIILKRDLAAKPGIEFLYSNFGYTIAGAMAERVSGKAWEQLLSELLLQPLGISSAGFGAPGSPGNVDQPWGHLPVGSSWAPVPPSPLADNPPVISPAGCVHLTISDWAKYAAFHLRGARGEGQLLKPGTFKRLHSDAYAQGYALGWGLRDEPSLGGAVLTHAGSNSMWFACIRIAPQSDVAVVVATNAGGDGASNACRVTVHILVDKFARPLTHVQNPAGADAQ